jgi:hypothetical protein
MASMRFSHHDVSFELCEDWWHESDMDGFVRKARSYRTAPDPNKERPIFEVAIEDVGPLRRASIFKDDMETERKTARERVLRLLKGFHADDAIPPVEVVEASPDYGYRYKLTHGAHRLYCSLAAGFTHIPAVKGFDWDQ